MKNENLLLIANCLDEIPSIYAGRFARIMRGETSIEYFGDISQRVRSQLNIVLSKNDKIQIQKSATIRFVNKYLLHTFNSGHLDGRPHGKNGHHDYDPLSVKEICMLPTIIKTVRNINILENEIKRGLQRFTILKDFGNKTILVITEVSSDGKYIDIVTAFHPNKTAVMKMREKNSRMATFS